MSSINSYDVNNGRDERVAIFIDGSNLYHSLEENCKRFDLDFGAFSKRLCNGRPLFRTYYYNVLRDPDRNPQAHRDQQKFLNVLYNTPYLDVRLGSSKMRGDVAVEKGIDVMVATDILRFGWDNLYDVAILVSGDGDFHYALQSVKDMGKHVEVAAFQTNLATELTQVADDSMIFTPDYFKDLWTNRRGSAPAANRGAEPRRRFWRRLRPDDANPAPAD